VKVTLTPMEQRLAKALARWRQDTQRANGVTDRRVSEKHEVDIDLEGAGAELALARVLNVYPDLDNVPSEEDMVTRHGVRVDVKATRYTTGRLLAVPWKKGHPADVYVLMVGKFPSYRVAGWIPTAELFQEQNLQDFGSGKVRGYALPQEALRPIGELA